MSSTNDRGLDLNLLTVFEAVSAEGSVTGAARRLGMTQSAVSHRLNRLREVTADALFERTGHGMRPTARARQMAPEVAQTLALARRTLRNGGAAFDPATARRCFTLEMPAGLDSLLGPILAARIAAAPDIDFQLYPGRAATAADALRTGDVDVALDFQPLARRSHHSRLLFEEQFVCVARRGNPRLAGGLDLAVYEEIGHVAVNWGRMRAINPLGSTLSEMGLRRRVRLDVANVSTMLRIVAETDLLGMAWMSIARRDAAHYGLEIHPLPFAVPHRSIHMIWHESCDGDPSHVWLREWIESICRTLGAPSAERPPRARQSVRAAG